MIATKAYNEIVNFLAEVAPQQVISFRPSEETQSRVEYLLRQEREAALSLEEKTELDHYLTVEHIMRLAKARAHSLLAL